jgi:hypothetical protein
MLEKELVSEFLVYLDGLTRLSALEDFTAYETAEN